MKLRRAIKRRDEITADCPIEGACQGVQMTQGKKVAFFCSYYDGTQKECGLLYVRCSYQGSECGS